MLARSNPASYLLALHQPQMPLELPAFPLKPMPSRTVSQNTEFREALPTRHVNLHCTGTGQGALQLPTTVIFQDMPYQ
jgi:hypothetical protein